MKTKKNNTHVQSITRSQAAALIDGVLLAVMEYRRREPRDDSVDGEILAEAIRFELDSCGLEVPYPCNGEAHSNPNIDYCGVCMPNWGTVSVPVRVR